MKRMCEIRPIGIFSLLVLLPLGIITIGIVFGVLGYDWVLFRLFRLSGLVSLLCFLGWLFSIYNNIGQKDEKTNNKTITFNRCVSLGIILLVLTTILDLAPGHKFAIFICANMLGFIANIFIVVAIYRVALKLSKYDAGSNRFATWGYFFLLIFNPIGIWFVQPRVIEICKKNK